MNLLHLDPQRLFTDSLHAHLRAVAPELTLRSASTLAEALNLLRWPAASLGEEPFVGLLVEPALPGQDPGNVVRMLRHQSPTLPQIAVTASHDVGLFAECLGAGCQAVIPKAERLSTLLAALTQVGLLRRAFGEPSHREEPLNLTGRQWAVLRALCEGQSNKRIARHLSICEATVKSHVGAIFQVLGVHSRTEAMVTLRRRGLDPLALDAGEGPAPHRGLHLAGARPFARSGTPAWADSRSLDG